MSDLAELIASVLDDNAHTQEEVRHGPGVYLSDPQGHAFLVGVNHRNLTVLDLVGAISIGGIEVENPDHLDTLGARLQQLAARLRARSAERVIAATRTAPSTYVLDTPRITQGSKFTANGNTFHIVGEPITVGWNAATVRVREVGGPHDGNEFSAHLHARG